MKSTSEKDWDDILVHVGMPRCASTYLQNVVFPALPVDIFQRWGKRKDCLCNEMREYIKSTDYDSKIFWDWIRENTKKQHDSLVISQETLGWDDEAYITARNLSITFPEAKILIIVRDQFDFLVSNYCYKVTTGDFHEFRTFNNYLNFLDSTNYFQMLEYDRIILYYQNLFGKKNIHVLPLEMLTIHPELFNYRVIRTLRTNEEPLISGGVRRINYSLRGEKTIRAMRILNRCFDHSYEFFKKIHPSMYMDNKFKYCYYHLKRPVASFFGKLYSNDPKLIELSDSWKEKLGPRFMRSNRNLNEMIDVPLEEYSYLLD